VFVMVLWWCLGCVGSHDGGGAEEVASRPLPCARTGGRHGAIGRKPSLMLVGHDGGALGGADLPAGGIFARYYALVVWDSRMKTSSIWTCDDDVLAS
jgi:hypothetical protein